MTDFFKNIESKGIDREPVKSSNLNSVGYKDGVLEIEFKTDRAVYQYYHVSKEEYENLMNAKSHGKYFRRNIRDKFLYTRIY